MGFRIETMSKRKPINQPGNQPGNLLARVQLIILEGRGPATTPLLEWCEKFPHVLRARHPFGSPVTDLLAVWRNQLVRWFLDGTRLPVMLMMDADCVPTPETAELVTCDAPVASARVVARTGREAHAYDGGVSCAALRVTRAALLAMGPPWFAFGVRSDGLREEHCECEYFADRARQNGYHPVRVGTVGHLVEVIAVPGSVPGMPPSLTFPAEWPGACAEKVERPTEGAGSCTTGTGSS
jgi:hypothetical protein